MSGQKRKDPVHEIKKEPVSLFDWLNTAKKPNTGAGSASSGSGSASAAVEIKQKESQPSQSVPASNAQAVASLQGNVVAPGQAKPDSGPGSSSTAQTVAKPATLFTARHTGTASSSKVHKWRDGWNTEFPWCVDSDTGMRCSPCMAHWETQSIPAVLASKASRTKLFVSEPCTDYRKENLRDHQKEKFHVQAVAAASAQLHQRDEVVKRTREEHEMLKSFQKQAETNRSALIQLILALYWLIMEAVAQIKLKSLLRLCKVMKAPDLPQDVFTEKDALYTSTTITTELIKSTDHVICGEQDQKLAASPFVAIMCDESTDVSITKLLIVYLRWIEQCVETRVLNGVEQPFIIWKPGLSLLTLLVQVVIKCHCSHTLCGFD